MLKILTAILYFGLLPMCVMAQQAGAINGSWTANYHTRDSGEREADVVISDKSGSWRDIRKGSQGKKNGCLDKAFPLSVTGETNAQIKIAINSASVIEGCNNRHVTLKAADDNTLEGTFADGRAVKLIRR